MIYKKELIFFILLMIISNGFIFVIASFLLSSSLGLFEYILLFLLFLFSTSISIYFAKELLKSSLYPIKNFKLLIEETMHEINTPIATIKTNAIMLKKNGGPSAVKKCERIELACDKLIALYENMEYFAKKEAKLNQKSSADIEKIIQKEIELYEDAFAKKMVNLSYDIKKAVFFIDEKGFSIALSNLLSNALKFTPSGNNVTLLFDGSSLCVKDEGIGISEEELVKIFDRYYKSDESKDGRGIGLFLVKEFCDDNGVSLHIRSKKGEGSEFTLGFDKIEPSD